MQDDGHELLLTAPLLGVLWMQADRAMRHSHAWRMAAAFTLWRDAAAQAQAAAAALQKALAFWARRVLLAAVQGWRGHTLQTLAAEHIAAGASH